jgi:GNAT superfamily N-acetyltransferase
MPVAYSDLDSRRFGRRIARVLVESAAQARAAVAQAREEGVEMLIARCPAHRLEAAQELERGGCLLMDTLVYYTGKTARFLEAPPGVRFFGEGDLAPLEAVARDGFSGYRGHYHADPRLDGAAATEGYVERFRLSTGDARFAIFVVELEGRAAGFLTLNHSQDPADIELNAVAPTAQGRGLYDALVKAAGCAARERGRLEITVSTQLDNLAPQKVWVRNGLEPHHALYTFHGWL